MHTTWRFGKSRLRHSCAHHPAGTPVTVISNFVVFPIMFLAIQVRDHYSGAGNSLKAGSWTAAKVEVAGPRYAEQYCLGVRTRKASGACVTRIIYATPATT